MKTLLSQKIGEIESENIGELKNENIEELKHWRDNFL